MRPVHVPRGRLSLLVVACAGAIAFVAGSAAPASAEGDVLLPVPHRLFNGAIGPLSAESEGPPAESAVKNPSGPICTTDLTSGSDVSTDCGPAAPHNETTIAVNPTNPANMIGGANDYQLNLSPGGSINETILSRAHVTFDGGRSWTYFGLPLKGYVASGDPAVAFDADGRAYYATLGFVFGQFSPTFTTADILVATSTDGGRTWPTSSRVAQGSGSAGSVGIFNDKEYVTAWGHGNAIVTWSRFVEGNFGAYEGSPIFASVTHDGGKTWSAGVEISGSGTICRGFRGDNRCDQDQASVPVVAADGRVYVTFINYSNDPSGDDRYLVVEVDPATGQRVAGPFTVGHVFDGFGRYPINAFGDLTYQDSQFRTWGVGNIAVDQTNSAHLAVAWSDMRNNPTFPVPRDPYTATTNSDIVVSQSFDRGRTWSAATVIPKSGDQFMPWAAYDASGRLRIGYFDRSYDSANHKYGYTLASEQRPGSLRFGFTRLSGALSDPTRDTRWFSGTTPNPAFPHPTSFLGDYSGITAKPAGGVAALWTDMREQVCFGARCGAGENAYYATSR
jgi:hypothetical protein